MASTAQELFQGDIEKLSQQITRSLCSPFGSWSTAQTRRTAIAIVSVYGAVFLLGLIGHACIVAYAAVSWKRYHSCRKGSLVILVNMSIAHMIFLLCCLPTIAYEAIMNLTFEPWVLGDVICRVVPFLELIILGVTVLSLCVLSIDRLRSSCRNTKAYEEPGETLFTGACKLIVIWVGAMLFATPELFLHGAATQAFKIPQSIFQEITSKDPHIVDSVLPQYQMLENPVENMEKLAFFLQEAGLDFVTTDDRFVPTNITFAVDYQFEKCESRVSLWSDAPEFVVTFTEVYNSVRLWWHFGFYFCFAVILSLLFAIFISLKLSRTHDQCEKEYKQLSVEGAAGTLTSHKGGSLNRSNSGASYRTLSSEAQQLTATEGRVFFATNNITPRSFNQPETSYNRNASPINSYPGGVMSPMIVRGCTSPQSPNEPVNFSARSLAALPTVTSQMYNVIGSNHRKTSSLPPHGRGSRRKSRMQKLTLYNISKDRALNKLLMAVILAFCVTWLPHHIFHIIFANTQLKTVFALQHGNFISAICRYLTVLSFAVNPVALFFGYKPYRTFMSRFCCRCCRKQ